MSDHPDVSLEMRHRVEEAVRALGYEPDFLAQSLRSGSTRTIGFIIRDIANPLYALIARACEQELRRNAYSMILMNSDGSAETESQNFALLRRRRVDGIIASLASEDSPGVKKTVAALRGPLVLLDRSLKGVNVGAVISDHRSGVYDATTHLLELGHENIAFVSGTENVYTTRNRILGFREAYETVGKKVNEELLALGGFDEEYALVHSRNLLTKKPRPTAFITGGIGSSTGTLKAINGLGMQIGKDVAFVALDEWPLFELFSPQISSVDRDEKAVGVEAARLLLNMLKGKTTHELLVETKFVARASSLGGL